jgi:hypothetical protein
VIDKATRRLEPGEIAPGLLQTFSDVLLATGDEKLVVLDNHNSSDLRISILKTAQTIRDLPVIFGYVGLTIDESTGLVRSFSANFWFFTQFRGTQPGF